MVSISFLIGLAMIGIVAGFASGLLGVGGGFLMVPLQYFLLTSSGVNPDLAMMVSLGTSLAIIIPTASSGAYEHQKKNRDIVRPGMLLGVFGIFGSFCGGLLANVVPSDILRFIFGILLFIVAVDMLVGFKREGNGTRVPFTKFTAMAFGISIGLISGLLGVGGGVFAVGLCADRRAERVVEVGRAVGRGNGIASADVRLVHELLVAALDEREAVPKEGFCLRRSRRERPTITAVAGRGELAVGMVGEGAGRVAVGDGENLVEIAVAVGLVAFADHAARRVVGVACRHAVGRGRDELVRVVKCEGGRLSVDGLLEHVAGLVVGVALDSVAVRVLHREQLALLVVLVRLADAVRGAGDDLAHPSKLQLSSYAFRL